MSSYGYFSRGRWSPFAGAPPHQPPEVRDSDYAYISQDDVVDPPSAYNSGHYSHGAQGYAGRPADEDGEAPDVLLLKHRGVTYPLHFPPYSVGEGHVYIGQIRQMAADKTGTRDPRRVLLLYKGKKLKEDGMQAHSEGLKHNSEIMCVVREASADGSLSSSEDEIGDRDGGVRLNAEERAERRAKKGHRGGKKIRRDKDRLDDYASDNLQSSTAGQSAERRPSPTPGAKVFDSSLPSVGPQSEGHRLALEQIAKLERKYRTEMVGPCESLLAHPPTDKKNRDYEVARLNEMIERDILLQTDAIETEGRDDVRTKRRGLVKEVQAQLQKLDAAKKRWAKD